MKKKKKEKMKKKEAGKMGVVTRQSVSVGLEKVFIPGSSVKWGNSVYNAPSASLFMAWRFLR